MVSFQRHFERIRLGGEIPPLVILHVCPLLTKTKSWKINLSSPFCPSQITDNKGSWLTLQGTLFYFQSISLPSLQPSRLINHGLFSPFFLYPVVASCSRLCPGAFSFMLFYDFLSFYISIFFFTLVTVYVPYQVWSIYSERYY